MASLQSRHGGFRVLFCYGRKLHSLPLGKVSESEAKYRQSRTEELLRLLDRGDLSVPPGVTVVEFMLHDGKPPVEPEFQVRKDTTLHELREQYLAIMGNGAIEANTLATAKIHLAHIEETLGKRFLLSGLTLRKLQAHIERRSADVVPMTVKKEIDSFRAAWNWGARANLIRGQFPSAGLVYSKTTEKLPFLNRKEIERRIKAGGNSDLLWECLYLDGKEVAALLDHVKAKKAPVWVYPMLAMAAHTGMRRSELIRCRIEDIDLAGGVITVREKKRAKGTLTTRSVPITKKLGTILKDYLEARKGSPYAFGYGEGMLSVQTTQKAFERIMKGSKWEVLKGWHTLRHSWISIMASKGVDQRIIDDCVGHSTEEQRRRYRHLFPQVKCQAIERAFA